MKLVDWDRDYVLLAHVHTHWRQCVQHWLAVVEKYWTFLLILVQVVVRIVLLIPGPFPRLRLGQKLDGVGVELLELAGKEMSASVIVIRNTVLKNCRNCIGLCWDRCVICSYYTFL